jgi:PAS domain-containing protein
MNGKGDKRRQGDNNKFNDNWDRIFGKKEEEDIDTSDVEPFHIKNARELKMQDLEFEAKRKEEQRKKFEERLNDEG